MKPIRKLTKKLCESSYYLIWIPIYTILWLIFDFPSALYEWSSDETKQFSKVMKDHYLKGLKDFG